MSRYYRLDGHTAIPATVEEWSRAFRANRTVAKSSYRGAEVSTVFLGLDHSFSQSGPPMIFETMIFGGEHDQWQDRCSTWEEAEAMHERACMLVRGDAP